MHDGSILKHNFTFKKNKVREVVEGKERKKKKSNPCLSQRGQHLPTGFIKGKAGYMEVPAAGHRTLNNAANEAGGCSRGLECASASGQPKRSSPSQRGKAESQNYRGRRLEETSVMPGPGGGVCIS